MEGKITTEDILLSREDAIKENRRRVDMEQEVFDNLCTDLTSLQLRKIQIFNPDRKNRCQNDELIVGNTYLVVRDGKSYFCRAIRSWFGWQFTDGACLRQLDMVDMVFEVTLPEFPKEPLGRVSVPQIEVAEDDYEDDWEIY